MDRISELPSPIIHQIMSYLSARQVAQTRNLSRTWNHLRKSFPILDFDQTDFLGKDLPYGIMKCTEIKQFQEDLRKFMEFVDVSLLRFCQLNICMQKFRLVVSFFNVKEPYFSMVDRWIGVVVENRVEELDVNVLVDVIRNAVYTLPQKVFSANWLTTLNLCYCKILEQPFDTNTLPSLKKLSLSTVYINEQTLQKLISQCPLLEDLLLSYCRGMKHLCVSNALRLKIFEICHPKNEVTGAEIALPCLQQFKLTLSSLRSEQRPFVIDMAGCPYLKKFKLVSAKFTDQEFHRLVSEFPLLEDLSLIHCDFLESITMSSHSLKYIGIKDCANLKEIHFDTPNLLSFHYNSDSLPPTASINAPCLWKVTFRRAGDFDTQWLLKLKEFLGVSNQIEKLHIISFSKKISFNFDELRESSTSLPCQVRDLGLHVTSLVNIALLDDLLWICHPRTLLVQAFAEDSNKLFEVVYRKLRKLKNRDENCCNSYPIKCWQHHLKDIKLERFNAADRDWPIQIGLDWCFRGVTKKD